MNDSKAAQANIRHTGRQAHPAEATSPWEWVVAAMGFVLIAGAIAFMAYYAIAADSGPPRIVVTPVSIEPNGVGYLVTVKAANHGTSTAAALQIEGELLQEGRAVEASEATIDYLPRGSERRAGLFFSKDPARYRLEIRPTGYTEP